MVDPLIVIGVPCREEARYTSFHECLSKLERPVGTPPPIFQRDNSVADSRNKIILKAQALGATHVFFLDDDQVFVPNVLTKLLARDLEMVVGLTMSRARLGGRNLPIWSQKRVGHDGAWEPVQQIVTNARGLMPLVSATAGGVLIKMTVFDRMPAPWFQMGQVIPTHFYEDIHFYERAGWAGVQLWGDPDVCFGHNHQITIWPHKDPVTGHWATVLADGFDPFLLQDWPDPVPVDDREEVAV